MVRWIIVACATIAGNVQAASLVDLLHMAWQRRAAAQALEARRAEASASRAAADALLPGPPSLTLSNRNDRLNENRGLHEVEVEVSAPLWLPGQRRARQALAEVEADGPDAAAGAARLALAGDLRRAVWDVIGARAAADASRSRRAAADALEADVGRRVRAGDLARSDALLARSAALGAQSAQVAAEGLAARSMARLRGLTGSDRLPEPAEEALRDAPATDGHPRMAAASYTIARARAEATLAGASSRDAPEIGVQYRRDRDSFGATAHDSFRFQVRIPFATEARNLPLRAGAEAHLTQSIAEANALRVALETEVREAALELEAARATLPLAVRRHEAAREAARLAANAFRLGEIGLADRLRADALAADAEADAAAARIAVSRAIATLNQAKGVLP